MFIGVADEPYIISGTLYVTTSVSFEGTEISPGELKKIDTIFEIDESSKPIDYNYDIQYSDGSVQESHVGRYFVEIDGDEYFAIYGYGSEEFSSLEAMNSFMVSKGLSGF